MELARAAEQRQRFVKTLVGIWTLKTLPVHGSLSFQMDLPVTPRKVSCSLMLTHSLPKRLVSGTRVKL